MNNYKADLQAQVTRFTIGIDQVGLEGVKKRIEIRRKDGVYSLNLDIKAFIDLPPTQRGAHMSRTAESIDECISEHIISPKASIEEFGKEIASSLLEKHQYSTKSRVELQGPFIVEMRPHEEKASTQSAYYLKCVVEGHRNGDASPVFEIHLSVTAEGMIACPCGQEMSYEFSKEMVRNRKDINVDEETLDKLLALIPIATHNQRARGTLTLQMPEPGTVDVMDMIEVIESSMSGRIAGILKRPDEANLIRVVHQDPLFTEDVLRRMAMNLLDHRFDVLPGDMVVSLRLVSFESIHPHQCSASTRTTMQAIRDALRA